MDDRFCDQYSLLNLRFSNYFFRLMLLQVLSFVLPFSFSAQERDNSKDNRLIFFIMLSRFIFGNLIFNFFLFLLRSAQFNDNSVGSWEEVQALASLKKLETVYLERNPIYFDSAKQQDPSYRRKVMLALPWVRQIDATLAR